MLLGGIWWWGARRATQQAPGNAELRESTVGRAADTPAAVASIADESPADPVTAEHAGREWGVPPFEPLSIRTADFDRVPALDEPMMVHADQAVSLEPPLAPAPEPPAPERAEEPDAPVQSAELQRIVTVRVCAAGEDRWSGAHLMAALEAHGLGFGRYQVFHRKHVDGRSLFCVASLIEPGTFDIAAMPENEFRGVTLFAVLPGPLEPVETVDELFATAQGLADELSGVVQDSKGMPLSQQRAIAIRSDVARFQAQLPRA